MPSGVKRSQKNPYSTEEERYQGDIELDSIGKEGEGMESKSRKE